MEPATPEIQTFGTYHSRFNYRKRFAAYAVIHNSAGEIAVVCEKGPYFLPGGGAEANESPEETVAREVKEELGCRVRIIRKLGEALQYFYADEQNYEMLATFFLAEITESSIGDAECELIWLKTDEMTGKFFHECHEWVVQNLNQ